MTNNDDADDYVLFADEENDDGAAVGVSGPPWIVLLVDDEPHVHKVTRLALDGMRVDDRDVELISAYSGQEGREVFERNNTVALAIIDVIMETDRSGLDLVEHIRNTLNNRTTRLILRTGQPGQAPEREIVQHYDINDYKSKTELTASRLFTSVVASLRGYRDLVLLKQQREELSSVNQMSQHLFELNRVDTFAATLVDRLAEWFNFSRDVLVFEHQQSQKTSVRVIIQNQEGMDPVPETLKVDILEKSLPGITSFLSDSTLTDRQGAFIFTRISSEDRNLIFAHRQAADVAQLSEESLSLLFQQLETAYSNTRLYSDLLELNLAMERFVPDSTLRHFNHDSVSNIELGQQAEIEASTLSLDIRGFTTLCEHLSSNQSFTFVNSILKFLGPVVERHHGSIVKFVGDGIIVLFSRKLEHAQDAVRCGIALAEQVRLFNEDVDTDQKIVSESIRVGIGIHSGRVHLATVGSASRLDVSVRSSSVSQAENLQMFTKPFGVTILIDDACAHRLETQDGLRYIGRTPVDKRTSTQLYQVIAGECLELQRKIRSEIDIFTDALETLENESAASALSLFHRLKSDGLRDPVVDYFSDRAKREIADRRAVDEGSSS